MRRALSVIGFNDSEVEVRFSSTDFPTFKDFFLLWFRISDWNQWINSEWMYSLQKTLKKIQNALLKSELTPKLCCVFIPPSWFLPVASMAGFAEHCGQCPAPGQCPVCCWWAGECSGHYRESDQIPGQGEYHQGGRWIVEDSLLWAWYHQIIVDSDLEVLINFTFICPKRNANP